VKLPGLSIVIPAYNEEASLEAVARDCRRVLPNVADRGEIIVIDDGSTDRTATIAAALPDVRLVRHPVNRGFGAAFRSGIEASRMEYVTLVPADGQFRADDLRRLAEIAPACDVAVGYRTRRPDPPLRKLNTLVLRLAMNLVFGVRLRDVNWVKIYRRAVLASVRPAFDGIGIDAEILTRARAQGFRFRQTRVGYYPRTAGIATGGQWKNVLRTLRELRRLASGRRSGFSSPPPRSC
jgi:dolichol-phosphate mannosyltransferase